MGTVRRAYDAGFIGPGGHPVRGTGHRDLVDRILEADRVRVGAPTLTETSQVFAGRGGAKSAESVEGLVKGVAVEAFRRFGRGRHPAALNYGDCLAYATARTGRDSLLFVGDDFTKTDITIATRAS